jgi:hypothetical protein
VDKSTRLLNERAQVRVLPSPSSYCGVAQAAKSVGLINQRLRVRLPPPRPSSRAGDVTDSIEVLQTSCESLNLSQSTKLFNGDVAQLDTKERRSCKPNDKGSTPFIAFKFDAGMEQGRLDGLISRATAGSIPAPANRFNVPRPTTTERQRHRESPYQLCAFPPFWWIDFNVVRAKR